MKKTRSHIHRPGIFSSVPPAHIHRPGERSCEKCISEGGEEYPVEDGWHAGKEEAALPRTNGDLFLSLCLMHAIRVLSGITGAINTPGQ